MRDAGEASWGSSPHEAIDEAQRRLSALITALDRAGSDSTQRRAAIDSERSQHADASSATGHWLAWFDSVAHRVDRGGSRALIQSALAAGYAQPVRWAALAWTQREKRSAAWIRRLTDAGETHDARAAQTIAAHVGEIVALAASEDGAFVVSHGRDGWLRRWDTRIGRASGSVELAPADPARLALHADGRRAITAAGPRDIAVADMEDVSVCARWTARSNGFVYLRSLDAVVYVRGDGRLTVRALDTMRERDLGEPSARGAITVIEHPEADAVLTFGSSGRVQAWNARVGGPPRDLGECGTGWTDGVVSPDARWLLARGGDGIDLWSFETGVVDPSASLRGVSRALFSSVDRLVVARDPGVLTLASVPAISTVGTIGEHDGGVSVLTVGTKGAVWSGGRDGTLCAWSIDDGPVLHAPGAHSSAVAAMTFAHDERALLSCGWDGSIRFWDAATRDVRVPAEEHAARITSAAALPSGVLVSAACDGRVIAWDVASASPLQIARWWSGHPTAVCAVGDPERVAIGGVDGRVSVWNFRTGAYEWTADLHESWTERLARVVRGGPVDDSRRGVAALGYVAAHATVVAISRTGRFTVLDARTGRLVRWFEHMDVCDARNATPADDARLTLDVGGALQTVDDTGDIGGTAAPSERGMLGAYAVDRDGRWGVRCFGDRTASIVALPGGTERARWHGDVRATACAIRGDAAFVIADAFGRVAWFEVREA